MLQPATVSTLRCTKLPDFLRRRHSIFHWSPSASTHRTVAFNENSSHASLRCARLDKCPSLLRRWTLDRTPYSFHRKLLLRRFSVKRIWSTVLDNFNKCSEVNSPAAVKIQDSTPICRLVHGSTLGFRTGRVSVSLSFDLERLGFTATGACALE
jgi:hypothetical protein